MLHGVIRYSCTYAVAYEPHPLVVWCYSSSNVVLRFKYATEISTQHILTTLEITESKTLNQISKHIAVCAQCNQSYFEVAVEKFASNLVWCN